MAKRNPLNLNPLQLKTLTLLQHLAGIAGAPHHDGIEISRFPQPHGDHFHLGDATVMSRDATGLTNQAVWMALDRKGLIRSAYPASLVLTPGGQSYDTGMAGRILHRADH